MEPEDFAEDLGLGGAAEIELLASRIDKLREGSESFKARYREETGEMWGDEGQFDEEEAKRKAEADTKLAAQVAAQLEAELQNQVHGQELINARGLSVADDQWEYGFKHSVDEILAAENKEQDAEADVNATADADGGEAVQGEQIEGVEEEEGSEGQPKHFSRRMAGGERMVVPRQVTRQVAWSVLCDCVRDAALSLAREDGVVGIDPMSIVQRARDTSSYIRIGPAVARRCESVWGGGELREGTMRDLRADLFL